MYCDREIGLAEICDSLRWTENSIQFMPCGHKFSSGQTNKMVCQSLYFMPLNLYFPRVLWSAVGIFLWFIHSLLIKYNFCNWLVIQKISWFLGELNIPPQTFLSTVWDNLAEHQERGSVITSPAQKQMIM